MAWQREPEIAEADRCLAELSAEAAQLRVQQPRDVPEVERQALAVLEQLPRQARALIHGGTLAPGAVAVLVARPHRTVAALIRRLWDQRGGSA